MSERDDVPASSDGSETGPAPLPGTGPAPLPGTGSAPLPGTGPAPLPGTGPDARTYRPGTAPLFLGGWAVLALAWLVADAVAGRLAGALSVLPGMLAVGALVHTLFWQPLVAADARGVMLRNLVRDVHVPWAALEGVDTRFALTLVAGGHRYVSWAAQARSGAQRGRRAPRPPGAAADVTATSSSRALDSDSGAAAYLVERMRPDVPPPGPDGEAESVVVKIDIRGLTGLVAAVVLAVAQVLL